MCSADLDSQAVPATIPTLEAATTVRGHDVNIVRPTQTVVDEHSEHEPATDALQALIIATDDARIFIGALEKEFQVAEDARLTAEDVARSGQTELGTAHSRLLAEFEVARAESALESLQRTNRVSSADTVDAPNSDYELLVLQTAHKITKKLVKDEQDPVLIEVSKEISDLARRFGATNIISVALKGNGNMDVIKGGIPTTYSGVTNGEKLRIKLAASIALIRIGHRDGIGRHPGLLFIDSPAAEEVPETDLRTMLGAMIDIAKETTMQIVVATTHASLLKEMLPQENTLLATGNDFVW